MEKILCFERRLLDDLGAFQGLSLDVSHYLPVLTAPENARYLDRDRAEQNTSYKQLIPYVVIVCDGSILRYRRGKGGGEARLHELLSIGIGGHISDTDNLGYSDGMRRELVEEIGWAIDNATDAPAVALINDDSNDVGKVHFGVVHVLRLTNKAIAGNVEIAEPDFMPFAEIVNLYDKNGHQDLSGYETWSQLCLRQLPMLLSRA